MWRQLPKDRLWNQVMRDYRAGLADPKVCLAEPKPGTVGSRSPAMTDYSAAVNAPERLLVAQPTLSAEVRFLSLSARL
jgi:hypothetical protein